MDYEIAERQVRDGVIETALKMNRIGLSVARSGNVSCRWSDGMLITPTGVDYAALKPVDISFVDASGTHRSGLEPSSEWRFHLAAYRARPEANGVVHCHSRHATALACMGQCIPAFHYMVAAAGGDDIPIAPYALFGTKELADHVADTLAHRKACLLAHHGQIATGKSLPAALDLAQELEELAGQFVTVLQLGEPILLSEAQMGEVIARFQTYGQRGS